MERKEKIIIVVGTTGAGKSKLGIDIAKKFDGEIISADSMQIYKGLDVATNKVTEEETEGIPHHLIGFLDITNTSFNSTRFVELAQSKITEILSRNKLPIVVGGTNQYISELIFEIPLMTPTEQSIDSLVEMPWKDLEPKDLYELLCKIDPIMGQKLHPNDHRKIIKYLEFYHTKQVKPSDVFLAKTDSLRYDVCVIWVDCEKEVLNDRLDKRVDDMLKRGLVNELKVIRQLTTSLGHKENYTEGIFQAIGYKEFAPFLDMEEEEQEGEKGQEVLKECCDVLKRRTARYAKVQLNWIRNHLLPSLTIYRVDSTDPKLWLESVQKPIFSVVEAFLRDETIPSDLIVDKQTAHLSEKLGEWKKYDCSECNKTVNGLHEWEAHLKSKGHKASVRKRKRTKEQENSREIQVEPFSKPNLTL